MFEIWDTNIIRGLAEGEITREMLPNEKPIAVSPIVIIEMLTRLTKENIPNRKKAANIIRQVNGVILAMPSTHIRYVMGKASDVEVAAEQVHFAAVLDAFIDRQDSDFKLMNGQPFERYREEQEKELEEKILTLRKSLRQISDKHGQESMEKFKILLCRTGPKWGQVMSLAKNGLELKSNDDAISLNAVDKLVRSFEPFVDVFAQFQMREGLREGKFDLNNFGDIFQFLYLQDYSYIVTNEKRWITYATDSGHEESVRSLNK